MHVDHHVCDTCEKRLQGVYLHLTSADEGWGGIRGSFTVTIPGSRLRDHDFCDLACLARWAGDAMSRTEVQVGPITYNAS